MKSYTGEVIETRFESKQMFPLSKILGIYARRFEVCQGLLWFASFQQFPPDQDMRCDVLAGHQTFPALPWVESPGTKDFQSLPASACLVA
jgi:hypothetical protein